MNMELTFALNDIKLIKIIDSNFQLQKSSIKQNNQCVSTEQKNQCVSTEQQNNAFQQNKKGKLKHFNRTKKPMRLFSDKASEVK